MDKKWYRVELDVLLEEPLPEDVSAVWLLEKLATGPVMIDNVVLREA